MKLNADQSKTNVCKEEVLMCIFKDVPSFLPDDKEDEGIIETNWMSGSHQEMVVGRQGNTTQEARNSDKTEVHKNLCQDNKTSRVLKREKKLKINLPARESSEEVQLWSCPFQNQDVPSSLKKQLSKAEKDYQWVVKAIRSDITNDKNYFSKSDLCEDCYHLTKRTCETSSSSEDDDLMRSWTQSSRRQLSEGKHKIFAKNSLDTLYAKSYSKSQVMRLLNEVESRLLECSILLTTHKLHKKLKKSKAAKDLERDTPSENEVLFDQIQKEDETKEGKSKLCLALGKLVSKYLEVK